MLNYNFLNTLLMAEGDLFPSFAEGDIFPSLSLIMNAVCSLETATNFLFLFARKKIITTTMRKNTIMITIIATTTASNNNQGKDALT